MKTKKDKIIGLKKEELEKKLDLLHTAIRTIKFKAEGSKSKNVKELRALKKNIARILTEVSRQRLASNNG